MGKAKGTKYSSYLDNVGQLRLEKFCQEFDCSKAKAISYLLELWENGTINSKFATISGDIHSQLESKLENLITSRLDTKLEKVHEEITHIKTDVDQLNKKINQKGKKM